MLKFGDKVTYKYKFFGDRPDVTQTKEIVSKLRYNLLRYAKEEYEYSTDLQSYIVKGSGKSFAERWEHSSPIYNTIGRGRSVGYMQQKIGDDIISTCVERINVESKMLEAKPMKTIKLTDYVGCRVRHIKNGTPGVCTQILEANEEKGFPDQLGVFTGQGIPRSQYFWSDASEWELAKQVHPLQPIFDSPAYDFGGCTLLTKHLGNGSFENMYVDEKGQEHQLNRYQFKKKRVWRESEEDRTYGLGWYKTSYREVDHKGSTDLYIQAKNHRHVKAIVKRKYGRSMMVIVQEKRTSNANVMADNRVMEVPYYTPRALKKKKQSRYTKSKSIQVSSNKELRLVTILSSKTGKVFRVPKVKANLYTNKWFTFTSKSVYKKRRDKSNAEENRKSNPFSGGRMLKRYAEGKRSEKMSYGRSQKAKIKREGTGLLSKSVIDKLPVFKPLSETKFVEEERYDIVTKDAVKRIIKASNKSTVWIDNKKYVRVEHDNVSRNVYDYEPVRFKTIFHDKHENRGNTQLGKIKIEDIANSMNPIKGKDGWGTIFNQEMKVAKLLREKKDKLLTKIRGL